METQITAMRHTMDRLANQTASGSAVVIQSDLGPSALEARPRASPSGSRVLPTPPFTHGISPDGIGAAEPTSVSELPVNHRFMSHMHDPLYAAAIGQPSRLGVSEGRDAPRRPLPERSLPPTTGMGDPVELGLLTEVEAQELFDL